MEFPVPVPLGCREGGNGNAENALDQLGSGQAVACGFVKQKSGSGQGTQSFVERRMTHATELAQFAEWHRTSSLLQHTGNAFVERGRRRHGYIGFFQDAERERWAACAQLDREGRQ